MKSNSFETLQICTSFSSTPRITCGPGYLADVIQDAESGEQFMIRYASSVYLLLVTETNSKGSAWLADDALKFCAEAILKAAPSFVCLFQKSHTPAGTGGVLAVSLLHSGHPASKSVDFWPTELSDLEGNYQRSPRGAWMRCCWTLSGKFQQRSRPTSWIVLSLAFLVLLAGAVVTISKPTKTEIWQRYDISGSRGPRYQLQFDHHNVSDWAAKYPQPNENWFLRIDDQSMIPPELVDEDELRYQRWFQQRYPEANEIRLNGNYLKEEFLSDYDAIQVPADRAFHMAHCVLAVRRYWMARESGRHICPRDIDHKHLKHCIDALDMWAFPEGPRGSSAQSTCSAHGHRREAADGTALPIDESDGTRLVWRTKVCFDK